MRALIAWLARHIWSDFDGRPLRDRQTLLGELTVVVTSLPLLALAIVGLGRVSERALLRAQWPLFLLLLLISLILSHFSFFQRSGRQAGRYSYNSSDLEAVTRTAALLILGPTAIWIHLLNRTIIFASTWHDNRFDVRARWNWLRNLLYNLLEGIISGLLIVSVYRALGGRLPLPGLALGVTLAAAAALCLDLVARAILIWLLLRPFAFFLEEEAWGPLVRQTLRFFFIAALPGFFGILGAALYSQMGLFSFLFFAAGVILVSLLAQQLSRAGIESQQRATELAQLERLGRAIIEAPAGAPALYELLERSLPQMFDYTRVEIRLFGQGVVVALPEDRAPLPVPLWRWFVEHPRPVSLGRQAPVPGRADLSAARVLLVPILATTDQEPIGGIGLTMGPQHVAIGAPGPLLSLQVLAAQVASALHRAETQREMLAYERVRQELAFARQIQASFLPDTLPDLPGWQLAATLQPARQTSGDFYDVIPLPAGRIGLVMADVADKGMGAALFMALSRTLVRTYALTFPEQPAQVLAAANARILEDTSNDMFVTLFYGVLDPQSGALHYANAGHNPPFVGHQPLSLTGMPLGILAEASWESRRVRVGPGETLVLYTDGVTEAHDAGARQFGPERLLAALGAHEEAGVAAMEEALWRSLAEFVGDADQFDDIALLLLRRAE